VAVCPAGEGAVSGGFAFPGIVGFNSSAGFGWAVAGVNDTGSTANLEAFAYCSPGVTTTPAVSKAEIEAAKRRLERREG
jgi:hypothetical protein